MAPLWELSRHRYMAKSRSYCYTLNNYSREDEQRIQSIDCSYHIYGRETAPTTGTPHLQGYIKFGNPRSLTSIRNVLLRCHISACKGTATQNIEYCSKSGDYWEKGTRPKDQTQCGKEGKELELARWESTWQEAKTGNIENIPPDIRIRCYSTIKRIKCDYQQTVSDLPPGTITGLWIWGPPRVGKSHQVNIAYPHAYRKPHSHKWWDGYQGEPIVWIDDMDIYDKPLGGLVKIWADRYAFQAEQKGGSTCLIRPTKIVITSNYSIDEIWGANEVSCEALKERFRLVHKLSRDQEILLL